MAYATSDDISGLYGDDELLRVAELEETGQLDADAVSRALDNASAEIDGYIGARYVLPVATTPTLSRLAVDISLYRLALKSGPRTAEHRVRYDDAIKFLTLVAAGKATVGIPETPDAEEPEEEYGAHFYSIDRC